MASSDVDASVGSLPSLSGSCRKCKKITQNGYKCVVCGSVSHASCVKLLKSVKIIDDKAILCCNVTDRSAVGGGNVDAALKSPLAAEGEILNYSIEVHYLRQIIDDKNVIIKNQADLIESLKQQILLLKNVNTVSKPPPPVRVNRKDGSGALHYASAVKDGRKVEPSYTKRGVKMPDEVGAGGLVCDAAVDELAVVRAAQLQRHRPVSTVGPAEVPEVAKLIDDCQEKRDSSQGTKPLIDGATGTKQRIKKRSGRPIIGVKDVADGGVSGLRAAKTSRPFHITKLHPETTSEDLIGFLKPILPEVKVEKLDSLHPEAYSSFKIVAYEENQDRILDPSIWPAGCKINRFFFREKRGLPGGG